MFKKVGFTGTQNGMTPDQKRWVRSILESLRLDAYDTFLHGDCIGADEEAHEIALDCGYEIHIYPPDNPVKRAFCDTFTYMHEELGYMVRNQLIVDNSLSLIATPKEVREVVRSGTWSTIRKFKKTEKTGLYVILPEL